MVGVFRVGHTSTKKKLGCARDKRAKSALRQRVVAERSVGNDKAKSLNMGIEVEHLEGGAGSFFRGEFLRKWRGWEDKTPQGSK